MAAARTRAGRSRRQAVRQAEQAGTDPFQGIQSAYNSLSPVYDLIFQPVFKPGYLKAMEWIHEYVTTNKLDSPRILDIGIGTGWYLRYYPNHYTIHGVDFSPKMLSRAQKRKEKLKLSHVELQEGDAMDLRFPDSRFDVVILAYLISTVPDPVRVLKEAKRVCKPGGQILILNHFKNQRNWIGAVERIVSPLFVKIGWTLDVRSQPLLKAAKLKPTRSIAVNAMGYWTLIECINRKK